MSDIDANHVGVLLERIADQNQAVLEAVGDMQKKVAKLDGIERNVAELKQDVKTIKAAVSNLSSELADHVRQPSHGSDSSGRLDVSRWSVH